MSSYLFTFLLRSQIAFGDCLWLMVDVDGMCQNSGIQYRHAVGSMYCTGALRMGFIGASASLIVFIYCLNNPSSEFQYCTEWFIPSLVAGYTALCTGYLNKGAAKPETGRKLVQFRFYRVAFVLYCIPLSGGLL